MGRRQAQKHLPDPQFRALLLEQITCFSPLFSSLTHLFVVIRSSRAGNRGSTGHGPTHDCLQSRYALFTDKLIRCLHRATHCRRAREKGDRGQGMIKHTGSTRRTFPYRRYCVSSIECCGQRLLDRDRSTDSCSCYIIMVGSASASGW